MRLSFFGEGGGATRTDLAVNRRGYHVSVCVDKVLNSPHFYSYPSCHHDNSRSPAGYEDPINKLQKNFVAYGSDNLSELICSVLIRCGGRGSTGQVPASFFSES